MKDTEIPKYRVWDKREGLEKMRYITGFSFYGNGFDGGNPDHKFCRIDFGKQGFMTLEVNQMDMMQYIGIEIEESPIYRGDILKTISGRIGEVVYHEERAAYIFHDKENFNELLYQVIGPGTKRIGNIYENPELINA